VDLAWSLLMDDSYRTLRHAIYSTKDELQRFRQLVVNSIMATNIVDKELKTLHNAHWAKAFSPKSDATSTPDSADNNVNRKVTIVIDIYTALQEYFQNSTYAD
jgi:hypothetical protein